MPLPLDLTGQTFGRLTVLARAENIGDRTTWQCSCECGGTKTAATQILRAGEVTSCGCLRREINAAYVAHGYARPGRRTAEYNVWCGMRQRCNDPGHKSYPRYGGRGIKVCERWDSFENFLADMGPRPSPKHSIERIDNADGDYEPGNCVWSTATEQANNRRNNHTLTHDGRTLTIMQWARETGLSWSMIEQRVRVLGWSVERALTTPKLKPGRPRKRTPVVPAQREPVEALVVHGAQDGERS